MLFYNLHSNGEGVQVILPLERQEILFKTFREIATEWHEDLIPMPGSYALCRSQVKTYPLKPLIKENLLLS